MSQPIRSGQAADLEYDLRIPESAGAGDTVAVLLHGRGSQKRDLQGLGPMLPPEWTLITPQAPFPGMPWGYGPGWAWYRYMGGNRVDEETLDRSLELVDGFLDALPGVLGFTPGRVVLGGFSQGGTTSIAYALRRGDRVAAVLNFSGFLAASVQLPSPARGAGVPPVFWGHGTDDPAIPYTMAITGRDALVGAGVHVTTGDYRIGHWIAPEEVADAVAMVRSRS